MSPADLGDVSMLDLFRMEAETQAQAMTAALLALERDPVAAAQLELCMRAAHSLKGAARIVGLTVGVSVAHAMEECFVAAQQGRLRLGHKQIDLLLAGTDLLARIANTPEPDLGQWTEQKSADVEGCLSALARILDGTDEGGESPGAGEPQSMGSASPSGGHPWVGRDNSDRVLRVTAENLNRLLGLAAQSLVESRWVKPFAVFGRRGHRRSSEYADQARVGNIGKLGERRRRGKRSSGNGRTRPLCCGHLTVHVVPGSRPQQAPASALVLCEAASVVVD